VAGVINSLLAAAAECQSGFVLTLIKKLGVEANVLRRFEVERRSKLTEACVLLLWFSGNIGM
tara:strand:+ start:311 stop:496 length:186 start_codon:yes stop_codon:yes gene_type:complete